ncbi:sialin-like isoform X2 [Watersipora subatra]|uniref:sialin-like isoform X2 n=1 Tax=Watersipora subatra TaxID=2589382 RepID=UPI00355B876E
MSLESGINQGQDKTDEIEVSETTLQTVTSCRWILAYVGCTCFTIVYALRINLSIAMICMVKPSNLSESQQSIPEECATMYSNSSSRKEVSGDIEWDKDLQGWVLSSFFYGYLVTQIPGGYLSGRFGGKKVMLVGMTVYGLVTVLTPAAARYNGKGYTTSAGLVIALRVIAGLSTGLVFPAMQSLLGHWSPPYERSKLNVLCFSGTMVGNVVMLGVGGFFCEWEAFDGGWPSIFYVGGGVCFLFCLLWHFLIFDSPNEHPRISEREKLYIAQSLEGVTIKKNDSVPWLEIMKSPAVWAIFVFHFCNNFGNYTLLTKLPAFMKEVLHFDIRSNGLYSTLPYIAMFIMANTAANVIDLLRRKCVVTTRNARKIASVFATFVPAAFLVAVGYLPCDKKYLGVVFLTFAVAFTAFCRSGYMPNPVDIAPKYAGEIFGISNTIATIPGMVSPKLVNAMTPEGTAEEWRSVFYVWGAIYIAGGIFFCIFARGETQPWAAEKRNKDLELTRDQMKQ